MTETPEEKTIGFAPFIYGSGQRTVPRQLPISGITEDGASPSCRAVPALRWAITSQPLRIARVKPTSNTVRPRSLTISP